MATSPMSKVVQHLRNLVMGEAEGYTDGQLLEEFLYRQDEAAFAALVRRHGPMVLGTCQRILQNSHDAEDAFQASFLVLVRKAGSFLGRKTVGDWLYGVAYNTALKARAATCKRRAKERLVKPVAQHDDQAGWHEIQSLLDAELSRLPDKYRKPVVLCDLEGKTRKEAAAMLGWPEGTLSGRLSRARVLLGKRLSRHGLPVSSGLLALVLSQNALTAGVSATLTASLVKAAASVATGQAAAGVVSAKVAALTQAVLKGMLLAKIKLATTLAFAIAVVGTGLGVLGYQTSGADQNGRGDRPIAEQVNPALAALQQGNQKTDTRIDKPTQTGQRSKTDTQTNQKNGSLESQKKGEPKAEGERKVVLDKLPRFLLKVPKAVLDAVKNRFPQAKLVGTSKEFDEGKVVFEIAIQNNEQNIDVTLTAEGIFRSIEKEIAFLDLPKAVADAFDARYPKAVYEIVQEVVKVKDGKETFAYYEVLLTTTEGTSFEVQVAADGKLLKATNKGKEKK